MTATATIEAQGPHIGPKGPDGRRYFIVNFVCANYNDASTLCSEPLKCLVGAMRKGGRAHVSRIHIRDDATTAGGGVRVHRTSFSVKHGFVAQPPDVRGPSWTASLLIDEFQYDVDVEIDPGQDHHFTVGSSGYAATDDLYITFTGWLDG